MDRNEFIDQIVAYLRENELEQTADSITVSTPFITSTLTEYEGQTMPANVAITHQAYDAFQYDYPIVDRDHLHALANFFHDHAKQKKIDKFFTYVTTAFLDGILYLNEYNSRNSSSVSHCNLIAASVLLIHFNDILHRQLKEATHFLHKFHIQSSLQPLECGTKFNNQISEQKMVQIKLHYIASRTISALFLHVPPATWQEWDLYSVLEDIIKRLLCGESVNVSANLVYGVDGEWKRYLFITRDYILNAPYTLLIKGLRSLKDLYIYLCSGAGPLSEIDDDDISGWRMVNEVFLSVFADLCASELFATGLHHTQQDSSGKKVHALVQVLDELLPTLMFQLQTLQKYDASTSIIVFPLQNSGESVLLLLQLLTYRLNAEKSWVSRQKIAKRFLEVGLVRSLLRLWPARAQFESNTLRVWQKKLLEWFAECCACDSEIAVYTSQVPGIMSTIESMEKAMLAPYVVIALTMKIQKDDINNPQVVCSWLELQLERLLPMNCKSFSDAMEQVYCFVEIIVNSLISLQLQICVDVPCRVRF